jgi:uncharacterized RDD family membrane protein YckC
VSLAAQRAPAFVQPAEAVAAPAAAYVGIVTRAIAFAVDAAVIQLVAIAVAGTLALILSVVAPSDDLDGVLAVAGAVAYGLWLVGYFVLFWSATGQTPGNRLLQIRVCRGVDGATVGAGTALIRFVGLILAALPLFAGFVPIVVDDRRRGAHDFLAGTVVVSTPPRPPV